MAKDEDRNPVATNVPTRRVLDIEGEDVMGEVQAYPTKYTVLDRLRSIENPDVVVSLLGEILMELRTIRQAHEIFLWENEAPMDDT